jgi:ADP-heptose:LPS heptosyltransferase
MGARIVIIKLGAIGDALRTTPILKGLRKTHRPCFITWITDDASYPLLEGNPLIDRLAKLDFSTYCALQGEEFDLLLSLDKAPEALGIAGMLKARRKIGFTVSTEGKLAPFNAESAYAYELGLFDQVKFRENKLSYPEIIFAMAGIPYACEEYILALTDSEIVHGEHYISGLGIRRGEQPIVGLNTGAGDIFATKKWTIEGFVELAKLLHRDYDAEIVLLGGPAERERNRQVEREIPFITHNSGNDNTLKQFASIIRCCDLIVTADTTALHIAIALKVPVIALFGSTSHQEICLYGRGEKVISKYPCSPCYRGHCPEKPNCMDAITAVEVLDKIRILHDSGCLPGFQFLKQGGK